MVHFGAALPFIGIPLSYLRILYQALWSAVFQILLNTKYFLAHRERAPGIRLDDDDNDDVDDDAM